MDHFLPIVAPVFDVIITNVHEIIFPDSTCVIFGASDDRVSLIVEGAGKNLVAMPFQYLQALPCLNTPKAARAVTRGRDNP